MAFDARLVCTDQLANGETPRGRPLRLPTLNMDLAVEKPWSAAKAKAHFWKWFTIDLTVVSLATYAFDLSMFWLWLFGAVPLVLRKRIIAFMMNPH